MVNELTIERKVGSACSYIDKSFPSLSFWMLNYHYFSNVMNPILTIIIKVVPTNDAPPLKILSNPRIPKFYQ